METESAVALCKEAIYLALMISGPILLTGIIVGFAVGLFQALTQIQEQTVAIILKMVAMIFVAAWFLPWMIMKLIEFGQILFQNIPDSITPLM